MNQLISRKGPFLIVEYVIRLDIIKIGSNKSIIIELWYIVVYVFRKLRLMYVVYR